MSQPHVTQILGHSIRQVRNQNEGRVVELMNEILPKLRGICLCPLCLEDVYARTLNHAKPHYNQEGLEAHPANNDEELTLSLRTSVEAVARHPRH